MGFFVSIRFLTNGPTGEHPFGPNLLQGNFQGNIIGAQNPILGDNASDGSDQREDPIGWPMALRGNTPSGQSKIFLPPLPPPPPIIFSPPAFSKPLDFKIGLGRSSEHLTNFDIRSSGDFSAGKPHVSVGSLDFKVNIPKSKFNNLKCL